MTESIFDKLLEDLVKFCNLKNAEEVYNILKSKYSDIMVGEEEVVQSLLLYHPGKRFWLSNSIYIAYACDLGKYLSSDYLFLCRDDDENYLNQFILCTKTSSYNHEISDDYYSIARDHDDQENLRRICCL